MLALVVASCWSTANARLATLATARAWLRDHTGQPDELAELKGTNPEAYAIVKALLTKRALGLLDPKHPSASFTPAARTAPAAMPQDEVHAAPMPHDWLHWKPQESAVDDDMTVKSVLGTVGDITTGGRAEQATPFPSCHHGTAETETENASAPKAALMRAAPKKAMLASATHGTVAAARHHENAYLKSIDFDGILAPTALGDVGAVGSTPTRHGMVETQSAASQGSGDLLASFKWDSPDPTTVVLPEARGPLQPPQALRDTGAPSVGTASAKRSKLLAWLGGDATEQVFTQKAKTMPAPDQQKQQPGNPYLADLQ